MQVAELLESLPDHRGCSGRKHKLSAILKTVLLGFLSGRDSMLGVYRFATSLSKPQRKQLGFKAGQLPCRATFYNSLQGMDSDLLVRALSRVSYRDAPGELPVEHIAIDGKHLRGSKRAADAAAHVLHAFATGCQTILAQTRVPVDTNEPKAMFVLLERLELDDTVITADAIFCQKEIVSAIRKKKGHYLIKVKENQAALKHQMTAAFTAERTAEGKKNSDG